MQQKSLQANPRALDLSLFARLAGAAAFVAVTAGCAGGEAGSGVRPGSGGGGGDSPTSGGGESGDGGAGATSGSTTGSSSDGGGGATATVTVTTTTASAATVTSVTASSSTGGPEQIAEVYAHSASTLYRVDLETNGIQTIGEFDGCDDEVVDIALDKDSNIYGTTYGSLWRIDKTNAECTHIADGTFPNSLSFVPAGTLDATDEALVGFVDADYVRIDTASGEVETIAYDALPGDLFSSGDIVSVIEGPTFLTAKGGECDSADCLLEINPVTGQAIGNLGSTTYNNVFGVAFWDGSVYGFTSTGEAFELVPDGNGGFDAVIIPVGNGISFYGAGSTTSAPKGVIN